MNRHQSASARGYEAELLVELDLLNAGYTVARPVAYAAYDLIAEDPLHSRMFRIQIKRAFYSDKGGGSAWYFKPTNGGGPYPADAFDYLAVVVKYDDEFSETDILYIPWEGQWQGHMILLSDDLRTYTERP